MERYPDNRTATEDRGVYEWLLNNHSDRIPKGVGRMRCSSLICTACSRRTVRSVPSPAPVGHHAKACDTGRTQGDSHASADEKSNGRQKRQAH